MHEKTIIIVDDDEEILNLFQHFLKEEVREVITLNCALKALEILKFKKIDLVITDILMPQMNGIEFTKKVQQLFPKLPVIVCSEGGSSEARDIVASIVLNKALFFGATYALKKPFNKAGLLKIVSGVLEDRVAELRTEEASVSSSKQKKAS